MKQGKKIIIQVGGAGKGCGKTSLIVNLLEYFPGSVYFKTALHSQTKSPHGGDDVRCLGAGASRSVMVDRTDESDILPKLIAELPAKSLVFLERNRISQDIASDYYIFLDLVVPNRRADYTQLRNAADFIVEEYPVSKHSLLAMVSQIKRLIRSAE